MFEVVRVITESGLRWIAPPTALSGAPRPAAIIMVEKSMKPNVSEPDAITCAVSIEPLPWPMVTLSPASR